MIGGTIQITDTEYRKDADAKRLLERYGTLDSDYSQYRLQLRRNYEIRNRLWKGTGGLRQIRLGRRPGRGEPQAIQGGLGYAKFHGRQSHKFRRRPGYASPHERALRGRPYERQIDR